MAAEHHEYVDNDHATMVEPASPRHQAKPLSDVEKNAGTDTQIVNGGSKTDVTVDAVWGNVGSDGPNYRNLGWIRAAVLETKTQIGLGVLGLPAVLDTLGFGPGVIIIVGVALIITCKSSTGSDYVIGVFKRNHPEVYTVADVGYIFAGPVGREFYGFIYWLMLTAIAASGMLSFSIALNAVSDHGTCTVAFVAVGAIISFLISCIQTLDKISWIGWVGVASIVSAVITLAAATGVQDRPSAAPQSGPFTIETKASGSPNFVDGINAVSIIVFAYAGTPNFFNIVGEMRNTKDYTKSVVVCQSFVTMVYLIIGCVVYHFTGQYIASPALGSAGVLMKKVCYGLAIPGLLVGCIINTHMPAKYVFVRLLGGTQHLARNTKIHYIVWFSCVAFNCLMSFIIAESIPIFDDLLSLIGALLGSYLCIQTEAFMYLWDTWKLPKTRNWWVLTTMNIAFIAIGMFLMVGGTYGAVVLINDDLHAGEKTNPFSCADNSNST